MAETLTTIAPKFRLVPIGEIDFARGSPDLVRGLLPNRGLAVLYGASGCGKSFLALDVALHVALGRSWASQRVEQAGVVYVAAEGAVGFRRRVVAARERLGAWEAPFAMIDAAPNLGASPGDGAELVASIWSQSLPMGWLPGLVVIDTTARVIPGLEENSAKDMGRFIESADYIARELRCMVLLVHHSGKNADAGMRGSSALYGACDAVWSISNENGARAVTLAKSKDGADNLVWTFTLEPVEIGKDEDGDPITTCVVANMSEPTFATGRKSAKPSAPPPSQRLLFASLDEALITAGENIHPFRDGPMVRGARRDAIREAFFRSHPAETENAKRVAFNRALSAAASAKLVIAADVAGATYVWRP